MNKTLLGFVSIKHLRVMVGPLGIFQHAKEKQPRLEEGYCTDDNVRAVQVLLSLKKWVTSEDAREIENIIDLCWNFVLEAEYRSGCFHNFRNADGEWLKPGESSDMYARIIRCCAEILAQDGNSKRKASAHEMVQRLTNDPKNTLKWSRGIAEALIAFHKMPPAILHEKKISEVKNLSFSMLSSLWEEHATENWPWFEETLTYANALLPHGLLSGFNDAQSVMMKKSAHFLIHTTIKQDNMFYPVGNKGWYKRGGVMALYDQQPIEAGTMFDFLLDFYNDGGDISIDQVLAPYLWFFGHNSKRISLVDVAGGSCFDGLEEQGPNSNCGAESLLAYLWAETLLRSAPKNIIIRAQERLKVLLAKETYS